MQNFHSTFHVDLFNSYYEMSSTVCTILVMMCLMAISLDALPVSKVRKLFERAVVQVLLASFARAILFCMCVSCVYFVFMSVSPASKHTNSKNTFYGFFIVSFACVVFLCLPFRFISCPTQCTIRRSRPGVT